MNRRQRAVVLAGIFVAVLMLLLPPWQRVSHASRVGGIYSGASQSVAGYGLLFSPPEGANAVDLSRLAVQFALVGAVTFGLFVAFGHKKD